MHLSRWKQALGTVLDDVWDNVGLRTPVLADNNLIELSDRIGELRKLQMLDLGHNKLRRLPQSLGDLDALTDFLYLHDNALVELPKSLRRLTRLPVSITGLTRLRELHARNNRLITLLDAIGALTELRQIDLRGNPILSLPESLPKRGRVCPHPRAARTRLAG